MKKDITLRDGTVLPRGTAILATTYGIHHDGAKYENPDVFDPFRFSRVRTDLEEERVKNQLVNTSVDYLSFGHGKYAWYVHQQPSYSKTDILIILVQSCSPGRFFAANELKALLAYIILNYDFEADDDGQAGPPKYNGLVAMPPVNAMVKFRKLELTNHDLTVQGL